MADLAPIFLPPQNWMDFERFLKGLVDVIWKQQGWQLYGRPGQNQNGIDLIGYDDLGRYTAIQAKTVSNLSAQGMLLNHSLLTEQIIKKEIKSAEKVEHPELERLIFATTSFRDVNIQNVVRRINHERKKITSFKLRYGFGKIYKCIFINIRI